MRRPQARAFAGGSADSAHRGLGRDLERRLLAEDGCLQALKLTARGQAELLVEGLTGLPIDLEGVSLAPGAVEGEHELSAQALPQRVVSDQGLELPDKVDLLAQGEVRIDALLDGVESQLLQARDLRLSEGVVCEVRERRTPPKLEGLVKSPRRGRVVIRFAGGSALAQQALETVGVQFVRSVRPGACTRGLGSGGARRELSGSARARLALRSLPT